MFYANRPSNALRFGDIVRGYVNATPRVDGPLAAGQYGPIELQVDQPEYSVVLSPCCSISDKLLLLAPLSRVKGGFFSNPYFAEDLTRINRKMEPQQAVPPDIWAKLNDEERTRREAAGTAYSLLESFVYDEHELLPTYEVPRKGGNIRTGHYMVDFRHTFRVDCNRVNDPRSSPQETKLLELSIQSRSDLREKIAYFYARVPVEDEVV